MSKEKQKASAYTEKFYEVAKRTTSAGLFEFVTEQDNSIRKHIAIWELQKRDRAWQFWLTVISVIAAIASAIAAWVAKN